MQSGIAVVSPSDEDLALKIAARGESDAAWRQARQACTELYQRHARRLLAFLSARVSRSDLEDIHQGVWERVWSRLPEGFRGGNFRAWLYQISRNYLSDHHRKKKTELLADAETLPATGGGSAEMQLIERERMARLSRCLEQLDQDAALLVRARLAGQSYDEVCGRTGIQPARAHKLFHTAKSQLQDCVGQSEP